jgi:ATP-dependent Lon protease
MVYRKEVKEEDLELILGPPRWEGEDKEREERRGLVYGLVVSGLGEGGILPVETCTIPSGKGELKLTGSLGEVCNTFIIYPPHFAAHRNLRSSKRVALWLSVGSKHMHMTYASLPAVDRIPAKFRT